MRIPLYLCAIVIGLPAFTGCANTWEKVSSNNFRENPVRKLLDNEDPMQVLRTKAEGSERASAMRRLKEPSAVGRSGHEQTEAIQMLEAAALNDPSPVVRVAAIEALGRFQDPRAVAILISAYNNADGATSTTSLRGGGRGSAIQQVGAQQPNLDPLGLGAPVGFEPAITNTIRIKTLQSLAKFRSPESIAFLSRVATGQMTKEATEDRNIVAAATRGLGQIRDKQAVIALTRVLNTPYGQDVVISHNVAEGLENLTGKRVPPDADKWNAIVQAGFEVKPEPNAVQRAFENILP